MPSLKIITLVAIALFVTAQAQYTIDPNAVPLATRTKWCQSQQAVCPLLCNQLPGSSATTAANSCDPATLNFRCICGNGLSPNATEYSQTIPYFTCTEWQQECVTNCGSDNACASSCRQDHPCGALDPQRYNVTSSSTAAAATATGADGATGTGGSGSAPTVYNGFGNGGAAATTGGAAGSTSAPQSAASALDLSRSYGILVVMTGLFAGFALVI